MMPLCTPWQACNTSLWTSRFAGGSAGFMKFGVACAFFGSFGMAVLTYVAFKKLQANPTVIAVTNGNANPEHAFRGGTVRAPCFRRVPHGYTSTAREDTGGLPFPPCRACKDRVAHCTSVVSRRLSWVPRVCYRPSSTGANFKYHNVPSVTSHTRRQPGRRSLRAACCCCCCWSWPWHGISRRSRRSRRRRGGWSCRAPWRE